MATSFDVIVIGSGFGGAITACRLAEKGLSVLVLERGRRWQPKDYPRKPGDAWIFDPDEPHKQNGWIDMRFFDDMIVVQGAGVGGGSLIYANVSIESKPELFNQGWPAEITYDVLKPYYDQVGDMLQVQQVPQNQVPERFKLMQEGAQALGYGDRFRPVPLAVTFDPEWSYDLDDPFHTKHSKTWTNAQGQQQGTCIHLGNCDLGCDVQAKNTLDLNYIPLAEQHGAEFRPLHMVRYLQPEPDGYRVFFDRFENGQAIAGSETSRKVILAAGSLGSTELLLRCRDQHKTLPNLSAFLGRNWSSNGDFLPPAFHDDRKPSPTQGPTISSAIDFLDGRVDGEQFFIEDGGFPDLLGNYLEEKLRGRSSIKRRKFRRLFEELGQAVRARDPLANVMPWFAQGIDAADGRLYLRRPWYMPWRRKLKLDWDIDRSENVINAIVEMHKRLAHATNGNAWVPPTWTILKNLVTPHPLGGCNMGTTPAQGVVNHLGEVFHYPNLYVADGAIVPEAIGLNPSRTIAALAERIADKMPV
ncbi:GMC family oxidoreductase [Candidatus Entotheonella palauensis]|uniref:Cholesterol oxidase n=1 Tax=Candidatus Entotheonella gemina TaxID=1429439 RepID=W4MDU3_9BACT|nr:GMC family oxidoreductase [Candidatus Entotheonella palauensis]ETX08383.1 MAG: choline dehydrogenase [Candidatus Entotheonella gemina]